MLTGEYIPDLGLKMPRASTPTPECWNNDNFVRLLWQLKALNDKNIVLTDVKFENILNHEGVLKFSDLGGRIEQLLEDETDIDGYPTTRIYCSPGIFDCVYHKKRICFCEFIYPSLPNSREGK